MPTSAGDRLGPYELVSRIGAGGMGEVWRARDTRLGRDVAVKILPADLADSADMRIRFAREAKTISQLDHPHICTLFDVGDNYLVMELLDGQSLADRLERGPLPLADVLRYGAQIAEALDRAHRAGVIHRDLKPGNVMITKNGAKLLDFGLAKSMRLPVRADSQTVRKNLTEEGMIVGTFGYMAPEQLEGRDLDARTDIFALGDVLYEMTTGKPAFAGTTRMSLVAAILSGEPIPVSHVQPLAPPALEHVIAKCLRKDPDERWQSARDVATELRWIGDTKQDATRIAKRSRAPWLVAAAAVLALIATTAWLVATRRPPTQAEAIETSILPGDSRGLEYYSGPPALSPDGQWLAYAARDETGVRRLRVRSIRDGTTRWLAGTEDAAGPFWSPDSRFIAFVGKGGLKKVAAAGGQAESIVAAGPAARGTWNGRNEILYTDGVARAPIYRVRADGGPHSAAMRPASIGAGSVSAPFFLPDGNHFLFIAAGGKLAQQGREGVWAAALDGSTAPRFLAAGQANAAYAEPGILLFVRNGVLRAQRFDPKNLRVDGEAAEIAPVSIFADDALFAATGPELLVYQAAGNPPRTDLVLKDRKGNVLRKIAGPGGYWAPRLSPDGRRIAVDRSNENSGGDIWIIGVDDAALTRFTFDPINETSPIWSPAGDEILYTLGWTAEVKVLRKQFGGKPQDFLPPPVVFASDWSRDGRHVAVARFADPNLDALVWSLAEKKLFEVSATPAHEAQGVFSPDGRWIAYQSDESGRFEIYVQPFPPTGAKHQVTHDGGVTARWAHPGEIAFVDAANRLNVVKVETAAGSFRAGVPEPLFPVEQREPTLPQFDVLPTGDFLVSAYVPEPPQPMTAVLNWYARLPK